MSKPILLVGSAAAIPDSWFAAPDFADRPILRVEDARDAAPALSQAGLVCIGWPVEREAKDGIEGADRRALPVLCVLRTPVAWDKIGRVPADRVACIGRSQARQFEAAGNRCEVIGDPSLDSFPPEPVRAPGGRPPRVLICAEPGGNGLADEALDWSRAHNTAFPAELATASPEPALEVLRGADAVIATGCQTLLRAMLAGRPSALLSDCPRPAPVSPAWRVASVESMEEAILELVDPPRERLLFQEAALRDALECATPALSRWTRLAREMLCSGEEGGRLNLPPRIVPRLRAGLPGPVRGSSQWDERTLRSLIQTHTHFARPFSQPPIPPEDIAVRLSATLPGIVRADSAFAVRLTVQNLSHWGLRSVGPSAVNASYQWLDTAGRMLIDGVRTKLAVPPRQALTLPVRIVAPASAGQYELAVTLVQEGLYWFHGRDASFQVRGRVTVVG